MKDPDCIGSPTDTGNHAGWQSPRGSQHLLACLSSDHGLKLTHHSRIRRRADDRADDVMTVADVRHPVPDSLARGILERARSAGHWNNARTEQVHAMDVERLPANVILTHVDGAFQSEARAHRCSGDAMLTRSGLSDYATLPHSHREQCLPYGVVDLVRACMIQVLALQVDARADMGREPGSVTERRWPPYIAREHFVDGAKK